MRWIVENCQKLGKELLMMEKEKNAKPLKGVSCDVCQCVHHGKNSTCCAQEIAVGPHNASSSYETVCATFKAKDDPISDITCG